MRGIGVKKYFLMEDCVSKIFRFLYGLNTVTDIFGAYQNISHSKTRLHCNITI